MRRHDAGFTFIELMITVAVFGIVVAAAVPSLAGLSSGSTLAQAQHEVQHELEMARMLAVKMDRPIRVRFNCPAAGQYRMVERIGTMNSPGEADSSLSRCSDITSARPAGDGDSSTRGENDGPLRRLAPSLSFGATPTLEFWGDGSVHQQVGDSNSWPVVDIAGTAVTIKKGTTVKTVTVNGLGRVKLQP